MSSIDGLQEAEVDNQWFKYWGDLTGKEIDADEAREARMEETREIHMMGVYKTVPRQQCTEETCKGPSWHAMGRRRQRQWGGEVQAGGTGNQDFSSA